MARPLRVEYEGAFYHVTSRGNEKKDIFSSPEDYEQFKTYLYEAREKFGYKLHAYVLMSNHFHLLIETPEANLNRLMHYINGSYTGYYNRKQKRVGHLFQGRYKAILVDRDSYLKELSRYMHLNPVRAGMVGKPEEYQYSSYRSYIFPAGENIVDRDMILGMVSNKPKEAFERYRYFIEQEIGQEAESPLKKVYAGMILGEERFIKSALKRVKKAWEGKEEISDRKRLGSVSGADEILDLVCEVFKVPREEVFHKRGDMRDTSIYLLKKYSGLTNHQIGDMFGVISYSAVSKAVKRFSLHLSEDRKLQKKIGKIISLFKG